MSKNLSSQRAKHRWKFSATATKAEVSPIRPADDVEALAPRVIYTTEAWQTIQYLVQKCTTEVGWLGLVDKRGDDYWITDIYVPKQEVSAVTTEIDADEIAALAHELVEAGKDTDALIYWGHSHVNMGVSPSGTDEQQLLEYLDHCPIFIRGIYNKRGEAKVDVFDCNAGCVYQCVNNYPEHSLIPNELAERLDGLIKDNLEERRFLPQRHDFQGYQSPHQGYQGYQGYIGSKEKEEGKAPKAKTWLTGSYDDDDMYNYMGYQ